MTKFIDEEVVTGDGWSRWILPIQDGYKMACCDCGLVHDMQFRVTDEVEPRAEFRVRRNNRSTGQIRRHQKPIDLARRQM